jgi:hypothetical protein
MSDAGRGGCRPIALAGRCVGLDVGQRPSCGRGGSAGGRGGLGYGGGFGFVGISPPSGTAASEKIPPSPHEAADRRRQNHSRNDGGGDPDEPLLAFHPGFHGFALTHPAPAFSAALLVVPEKYAVQHERAGQHEYARAKSKAVVKLL